MGEKEKWCTSDEDIGVLAERHFTKIFTTTTLSFENEFSEAIDGEVTDNHKRSLLQPFTAIDNTISCFPNTQFQLSKPQIRKVCLSSFIINIGLLLVNLLLRQSYLF